MATSFSKKIYKISIWEYTFRLDDFNIVFKQQKNQPDFIF